MSFSLYRVVHQSHHAHLATERDEGLAVRQSSLASGESPGRNSRTSASVSSTRRFCLFAPSFGQVNYSKKDLRRRIWNELSLAMVLWVVILGTVGWWGLWKYLFWVYLAPAWLAANMQSLRKYVGTLGSPAPRSAVPAKHRRTRLDREAHRLHLAPRTFPRRASSPFGFPHAKLPRFVAVLEPAAPSERPPFPNYWPAFLDLFRSLADPRVGAQWNVMKHEAGQQLAKAS